MNLIFTKEAEVVCKISETNSGFWTEIYSDFIILNDKTMDKSTINDLNFVKLNNASLKTAHETKTSLPVQCPLPPRN